MTDTERRRQPDLILESWFQKMSEKLASIEVQVVAEVRRLEINHHALALGMARLEELPGRVRELQADTKVLSQKTMEHTTAVAGYLELERRLRKLEESSAAQAGKLTAYGVVGGIVAGGLVSALIHILTT